MDIKIVLNVDPEKGLLFRSEGFEKVDKVLPSLPSKVGQMLVAAFRSLPMEDLVSEVIHATCNSQLYLEVLEENQDKYPIPDGNAKIAELKARIAKNIEDLKLDTPLPLAGSFKVEFKDDKIYINQHKMSEEDYAVKEKKQKERLMAILKKVSLDALIQQRGGGKA